MSEEVASVEMPKYRCHKTVHALKIESVTERFDRDGCQLHFFERDVAPMWMTGAWMLKHTPVAGGYLVFYEDGYKSFSPGDVFEAGYSAV